MSDFSDTPEDGTGSALRSGAPAVADAAPISDAAMLRSVALDPARSVVVEACAGSGKTWLLAARIVRLLLAGAAPGEILAITFTRKAAREIEERVIDWLRLLATDDTPAVTRFLVERGVVVDADTLRRARGLFERVAGAQPGLAVNTFHGWFLQLVAAAPLSADLAGATLVEGGARLFDECWQEFVAEQVNTEAGRDSARGRAFVALLRSIGQEATRSLLQSGLQRRAEWLSWLSPYASHSSLSSLDGEPAASDAVEANPAMAGALLRVRQSFGLPVHADAINLADAAASYEDCAEADDAAILADFFAPGWALEFHAYLGLLELSELASDQGLATSLRAALADGAELAAAERLAALRDVFLTAGGALRARKPGKTLDRRFGSEGAARFLALHVSLGERVLACLERRADAAAFALNRDALVVIDAFLEKVEAVKSSRRIMDFVDAEWRVLQLLRDSDNAAYVQARLDARYRHVLLDEFQDANPLQWQILLAWFDAYSDAARPSVFLVGDPKQSIYRFRRAEPRLFAAASEYLSQHFAAARCLLDMTRRNAQPVVDVVNTLFAAEAAFQPFREQSSAAGALPGRVELLPLCAASAADSAAAPDAHASTPDTARIETTVEAGGAAYSDGLPRLRDPLREPAIEMVDTRRQREAAHLAASIQAIVGHWQVHERDGTTRLARYGDILLLARTRTQLAIYERALAAAGIPFVGAARGGLLRTLEARDITALLEFLVNPAADLALAHALRSPLFGCADDDLLLLAQTPGADWWARLRALTASAGSVELRRAAGLLSDWREAAQRLPAHDLLDRIFHQGQLRERYRYAVPAALRERVDANLGALLLLALDLDGGRYPSLPRFIDELRVLNEVADDEAPDEGAIEAPAEGADAASRVRILTIHGAKGLEAPIVWLLDAHATTRPESPWQPLVEWPPTASAPSHFSIRGSKELRGRQRDALFAADAAAAAREELNLLYVAITRARQVFIASGIAGARDSETTPYRRLERALAQLRSGDGVCAENGAAPEAAVLAVYGDYAEGWCDLSSLADLAPRAAEGRASGDAFFGASANKVSAAVGGFPAATDEAVAGSTGETQGEVPDAAAPTATGAPGAPVGVRRGVPTANERFGVLLHAILEHRTGRIAADEWWLALGFSDEEYRAALPAAERLLNAPILRRFFDPQCYRRAWDEAELVSLDGRLLRLDRLVEFANADGGPGELWVLDYKSSAATTSRLAEYQEQVDAYCRAIAAIFAGRPVRGMLAFASGDLSALEVCVEQAATAPVEAG
ncbi:UvrD-helicase domain-containing protein [Rhodocyclus tenuis]|uniref:DNA 3'-5' helicase n=1 Tax=Rhodocyclus gracilis TaxID=2929842 RepID=A0ABX0WH30_9RHOO|nr:UvrD-helicase domain-containing protein [Rhodocyclus gracilis]NJA87990.1 UvrD-helicase domain-containing protein [Rhodocyclus gracilis]